LSEMNKAKECMKAQAIAINKNYQHNSDWNNTKKGAIMCYLFNLIHLHQLCDSNPYSLHNASLKASYIKPFTRAWCILLRN
jgi:hypothetical protein